MVGVDVEDAFEEGAATARGVGDHAAEHVATGGKRGFHDHANLIAIRFDRQIGRGGHIVTVDPPTE